MAMGCTVQCPKGATPFLVEIPLESGRAGISRLIVEVSKLPFSRGAGFEGSSSPG